MFDLLVFTQYPQAYAPKRFKEEAEEIGLVCKIKSYGNLVDMSSKGRHKYTDINNLPEAKFVILREPTASKNIYDLRDKILNRYLSKKVKVLNSESYLKWSILDKQTQKKEFEKNNIPHIKSIDPNKSEFPFVVKAKLGSHGSHVFKIESKSDLNEVFKKYKKEDLLFQEFQSSGFDLRVIVLNGEVLGIMKRTPRSGEFLSNFSQGGTVERYIGNDREDIKKVAVYAAFCFKLDYVGVDLMRGNNGEWKVLEVNRACQFQGFEKALGVDVSNSLLKFMLKDSKKSAYL